MQPNNHTPQADFAAALLDPDAPIPAGLSRPGGGAPVRRFAVYRNNVVTGLIDALGDAYPACKALVGERFFNAAAGVFVRANPPRSPLMFAYGAEFPDFLAGFEPAAALRWLPDVARLELARREAYHAADAQPDDGAALAAIAPERLGEARLKLHPSMRITRSRYPAMSIWEQAQTGGKVTADAEDALTARPLMTVETRRLRPGGADFLLALAAGATLGEAAEAGARTPDFDIAANIAGLIEAGLLLSASLDADEQ